MGPDEQREPPSADVLAELDADSWAQLLPHIRAVLDAVPADQLGDRGARLRSLPTGRLAGGRAQRELSAVITADPRLWSLVWQRIARDRPVPDTLARLGSDQREVHRDVRGTEKSAIEQGPRAVRDRERVRAMRDERDAARRQAAGAEARAEAAQADLAAARTQMVELRARVEALELAAAEADRDRERAVERERRRRDTELAGLQGQVADLRRAEEHRRAERRKRAAADEQTTAAVRRQVADRRDDDPDRPARLVPGRPSRLPEGLAPDTTESVELYLHRGRRVLVDGYNVTKQHRPELDLAQQRSWLIGALANLARRRGVRPTVVFDGERVGGGHRSGGGGEVTVRFTGAGMTADDHIVLELESTDDPVLVVTDDRELVERCRRSRADVIGTRPLLWVAG